MALPGENQPPEKNFYPNQRDPQVYDKPHIFKDGRYIEHNVASPLFPKVKYHADYVHNQKPGKEYDYNQCAQIVANAQEETELGSEWKDAPNVVTCPDVKQVMEQKKKIGSNWREALELPADINETHVAFLQSQGLGNITNVMDACAFLGKLGSAAMTGFMKEAEEWSKTQIKRGPGRPKNEA